METCFSAGSLAKPIATHTQEGFEHANASARTAQYRTTRLAARGGPGCKRWHSIDSEPGPWRRSRTRKPQQRVGRRALLAWSLVLWRWLRGNMCRYARSRTLNTPTLSWNGP